MYCKMSLHPRAQQSPGGQTCNSLTLTGYPHSYHSVMVVEGNHVIKYRIRFEGQKVSILNNKASKIIPGAKNCQGMSV